MKRNACPDCIYHREWEPEVTATYHSMCEHPKLFNLTGGNQSAIRCHETRDFAFACGVDGNWFIRKNHEKENAANAVSSARVLLDAAARACVEGGTLG